MEKGVKMNHLFEISYFNDIVEVNIKKYTPIIIFEFIKELDKLKQELLKQDSDSEFAAFNKHGDIMIGKSV